MQTIHPISAVIRCGRPGVPRLALIAAMTFSLGGFAAMVHAQGGALTPIKIFKDVSGGDPMTGTLFNVSVNCTGTPFSATIGVPAGTYAEVQGVPAPNTCTVTEDPALPSPPAGYVWEAATTPPPPITIAVVAGEEAVVTIFNRIVVGEPVPRGSIVISKTIVGGALPGASFDIGVVCSTQAFSANVSVASGAAVTVSGIPAPNQCTITESNTLPAPPAGFIWDVGSTPPAPVVVTVVADGSVNATVTNTLASIPPDGGGSNPPTVLPTLGQFSLALLGLLLAFAGGLPLYRRY